MKAKVQYNDLEGNVAADINDFLSGPSSDDLKSIGKFFGLNQERFEIIGLSIYGSSDFLISLICVDKERSDEYNEHIVKMLVEHKESNNILEILFKILHIVFHNKFDDKYQNSSYSEEVNFSDFHEKKEE